MRFYWIVAEISRLRRGFLEEVLPIVDKESVEESLEGFSKRKRVYHSWRLFVMFLSQTAGRESCRKEIAEAIGYGLIPLHTNDGTSAYCNARNRLPEEPLRELGLTEPRNSARNALLIA